ncbi:phospholipase D beta 2-like [Herrania umbratica]|uniref:phospholipase D n=1 Tax=Herrania umbratica TaxID=108875 RepID=A0A6J0ZY13_9ROSI|nr:phospholipase D beta 2-like [Herrania umbratica]
MDNYPYNNPYSYPYHHGYPPPNQDPYAPPPPYQYPYSSSHYPNPPAAYPPQTMHSAPLDYSYSPCGPIPYQYPYPVSPNPIPQTSPPPTLQHHGSFQYGSSPYPYQQSLPGHYPPPESNSQVSSSYQQSAQYPPPESNSQVSSSYQQPAQYPPPESNSQLHSRNNSFSGHDRQESTSSLGSNTDSTQSHASAYPPLDDLLSNVHLSDSRPTVPASPPAPSGPPLPTSASTPEVQSPVYGHASPGNFYAYPNNSFSSNWEGPYWGRMDSSNHSAFAHSGSFNGSQHSQGMQIVPFQKGSLRVLLLHGNLDIWVCDAKNLPNMDMFHKTLGDVFGKLPVNVTNKIEGHMNRKITSDPYVSIAVGGAVLGRTYVISNSENPVWMQHFYVPVAHYAAEVHFVVKDSDVVGSQLIGIVPIPVEQIYSGEKIEGIYPILNNSGKPCKPGAVLRLSIQYTPMEKLSFYHHGVGAGPDYLGVPGTYFPLRKGGAVTLYQDAHVPDGCLPNLKLDQGMTYVHGKCWHDIFDAIRQARRLIYITGWSVWHKVRLVRDTGPASDCTLGDILRSKSQEGVRVLLLIWDDPTSRSILGYKTDGIMQTHDEETRRFFKHSSVQVLLCPRIAGKRHSWIKQKEVGTIYTHHQKTVIVDADAGENRRKIIAFLGGLDLCDGRYDSPHHPIFRTLQTVHKDDYHNPTFTGNAAGCPREPWHDLHCRIDGPAAYDVLVNFEERWLKAAKPHGIKKLKMSYDDALLRLERIPDIVGVSDFPGVNENEPEAWHVQIFRSIDSNSVKGFPKDPKDATSKNLVCGKNVLIDMSIHTAYVKAIRAAQHFIYIENQYFIGSSYNWNSHRDLGANNLIPMEIALKIASKIKANERFAAYIVVPMWPEGVPTGAATQRILFWQHKTMQMMFETIYRALVEAGLEGAFSPQDYLNFFCLGNREADGLQSSGLESPSTANTPQALSRKSQRFMIYVHSKGMIVDDEYVILGSANINQRSMEGTRDTEIAMGAYQPQHTWARKHSNPHGQIYGYRMSLWAEHLGVVEDCFTEPESIECVRRVKQMAEMNWKQFAADEVTEMRGHLLNYPVEVDRKGKVRPLPGCESFPDVGGNIVGSFLGIQENLTI